MSVDIWNSIWKNKKDYKWDPLSDEIFKTLKNEIPIINNKKILEAGSGCGMISLRLALEGAEITLLDYSNEALKLCKTLFKHYNINANYILADLRKPLPFENKSYDIVWNAGVMEHFHEDEQINIVSEFSRISKEFHTFNPNKNCIPYKIGKWYAENNGLWPYGEEYPVSTMKKIFKESNIKLLKEYCISQKTSYDFLSFIPGGGYMKKVIGNYISTLSLEDKKDINNKLGGYLLYSKGISKVNNY